MITPELTFIALTSISVFLTTIGGLIISAVNLKEVCKAKAAGDKVTITAFYTVSIVQVYNDALS